MTFRRSSAALGLAVVFVAGAAQAQQTTPEQPNHRPGAEMGQGRGMRGMQPGAALLRGVNLTDEQKQRLRTINEKYDAEGQKLRAAMRPAGAEARGARQRGDTAAARQAWQGNADQRQQFMALQGRRMTEVRGVLTAEQQRQFDANRTEMQERMRERRGGVGGQGRQRPDSTMQHGPRRRVR